MKMGRVVTSLFLAASAAIVAYFSLDLRITQFIQRFDDPYFQWLMIAVSWPGYRSHQWIVALGAAALLFYFRRRIEAACVSLSLAGSWLLVNTIKFLVARPRPTPGQVRVYLEHPTWSFPSGHVANYMALYGFLFYLVHTLMRPSILRSALLVVFGGLIGLVGLSRVYLGAHWASDALGAYCLGLIWLTLMIQIYLRLRSRSS
jgi:undecaprenyl-diphosphatase